MLNFVYQRLEASTTSKIDVVASTELFTEHYLRRHFSWYNSELWMEDLVSENDMEVLVCLAENDEIISTTKVKKEVERHPSHNLRLIHWDGVGHAHCIGATRAWNDIRVAMLEQEESVLSRKIE